MNRRSTMLLFLLFLGSTTFLLARTIELDTGEAIVGEILRIDKSGIVFQVKNGVRYCYWDELSDAQIKNIITESASLNADFPLQNILIPSKTLVQTDYLYLLLKDTWNSLEEMIDTQTWLPFDNNSKQKYTSTSNIGLYLASLYAAQRFGFMERDEALALAEKALSSIKRLFKWHGFPVSWIRLDTLRSTNNVISPIDSGNLAAGIVVIRNAYPELRKSATRLLEAFEWEQFYDEDTGRLLGGYNSKKGKLPFFYNELASDTRLASFFSVASGRVPLTHWKGLDKTIEERYGLQYLTPGWKAGGIFLHGLSGLFLDERGTLLGLSMGNILYAQIIHARENNYPVWGWSCSSSPTQGYIGTGKIKDEIVTPHASLLGIWYYPQTVVANLLTYERLNMRHTSRQGTVYGFRDAYNMKTKKITKRFLFIDQAMIFLSLANYLGDGIIWDIFKKDSLVKAGLFRIELYHEDSRKRFSEIFKKRDESLEKIEEAMHLPLQTTIKPFVVLKKMKTDIVYSKEITVDGDLSDWRNVKRIEFPLEHCLEVGAIASDKDLEVSCYFAWDKTNLYLAVQVIDEDIIHNEKKLPEIWKDDCVELFIDPDNNKLIWGAATDFQIGFSPSDTENSTRLWSWFQGASPIDSINVVTKKTTDLPLTSYIIEAAIQWKYIGIKPKNGLILCSICTY
ncbi:glucoamylase family protein [Chlamydiota bacterium]